MTREALTAAPTAEAVPAERGAAPQQAPMHLQVLALQRAAGNRAVANLIAGGKLPPGAQEDAGEVPVGGWLADMWRRVRGGGGGGGAAAPVAPSPAPAPGVSVPSPAPPASAPAPTAPAATAAPAATPPKLSKKVIEGPTPRDCGGWKWVIQWKLDKPSTTGGWVVQKVTASRDVKDAAGTAAPVGTGWDPSWTPYWEGWKINAGQKVTTYAETGDFEDDTYAGTAGGAGTKGTFTMCGRADFYEGATLPATMKPTNTAPAWILPFTKSDPALTGGTGAIDHDLTAAWDCTGTDKKTTITTV